MSANQDWGTPTVHSLDRRLAVVEERDIATQRSLNEIWKKLDTIAKNQWWVLGMLFVAALALIANGVVLLARGG